MLLLPIFLQDHNYTCIRSCEAIPQLSGGLLILFFYFILNNVYFYVYQFTNLLTAYLSFLTFQLHFLNSKHLLAFALGSPSSTATWKHSPHGNCYTVGLASLASRLAGGAALHCTKLSGGSNCFTFCPVFYLFLVQGLTP